MSRSPTLLLAIFLAACTSGSDDKAGRTAATPAPVTVEVEVVKATPLAQELVGVGSLRSDESVTLRSEIVGRVARIGFTEGQQVARGALLFELDDSVFRAELDQARANERLTRRNYDRAVELSAQKLVSASDRDAAAANQDVARASLALAEARAAKTRIVAPFSGIVGLRQVSPGDYVAAGQALVNLEAMNPMKIDFRLPESALPVIAVGQGLDIEVDAYPGQRFRGEVYAIDPRVADESRSIALRAHLDNAAGKLRPGLFARVRLQVSQQASALLIPEQAIFPRGEQQFVYVVADGKAALREVRLGQRVPGKAQIVGGLTEGETVVTAGLQKLGPGMPVTPAPAVAAPGPAKGPG
ncbi:MAG TPA: efflux RND transporter periplasmic adaptor subunit [Solimonas sp.]|nr:efflux RND transporter periplasmic adaptor subunit [Solimonas sp.]